MKVFKITYTQGSNKSSAFLATNGKEMKEYFQKGFPGLPELKATSFKELKEELANHNFILVAKVEPYPMSSIDALAEVNTNRVYSAFQLKVFVSRTLRYDTIESLKEYQEIVDSLVYPVSGVDVLAAIR